MRLSVVVTVVDSGDALDRCLTALAGQDQPPELDVIVPWDSTIPEVAALGTRFPTFRFPPLGTLATARPAASHAGQHELYDRRRAAALAMATGDVIGVLEDRGVPGPEWARTLVRLHQSYPHAVIGGAIVNGRDATLNWAVYFCDFGRFQPPFASGPRQWVSDINVGYKRQALDQTRDLWRDRYHETTVHWALQRAGATLFLTPDLVVSQQRGPLRFLSLLRERVAWGRLYAWTRARELAPVRRIGLALMTPLLPVLLFFRIARLQIDGKRTFGKFAAASPAVAVLLIAWSVGEAIGYITAEP